MYGQCVGIPSVLKPYHYFTFTYSFKVWYSGIIDTCHSLRLIVVRQVIDNVTILDKVVRCLRINPDTVLTFVVLELL